jgi:hypothetical protein
MPEVLRSLLIRQCPKGREPVAPPTQVGSASEGASLLGDQAVAACNQFADVWQIGLTDIEAQGDPASQSDAGRKVKALGSVLDCGGSLKKRR